MLTNILIALIVLAVALLLYYLAPDLIEELTAPHGRRQ